MIIDCVNCNKKFNVNSELIPEEGRTIQCGSCNHIWFFKKISIIQTKKNESLNLDNEKNYLDPKKNELDKPFSETIKKISKEKKGNLSKNKSLVIAKKKAKSNFTISKLFSFVLVLIISFVGFIILLDTFKSPLYDVFPNLEFLLFSFYETLKDLSLFIQDLI